MEVSESDVILRVKVEETSIVYPEEATERRSMYLSNIDQVLLFTLQTLHFFAANNELKAFEDVVEGLKRGLSKLLVYYDFLAGRLKLNTQNNRLEVDCNGTGAPLLIASTHQTLQDLQDITYPNPDFRQFVPYENEVHALEDRPLCLLQVTRFKCGGFVIGLGVNHTLLDGIGIANFLRNLASLTAGEGLAVPVSSDRSLLKARSPPCIEYDHPELVKLEQKTTLFADEDGGGAEKHEFRLFKAEGSMVTRLKAAAVKDGRVSRCSSFEAVIAHLWRARTLALRGEGEGKGDHRVERLLFAMDVRRRMTPPLPSHYAGNAVLFAYATATAREMADGKLSSCVEKVQEGVKRMTDDYIRSVIDWGEVNAGVPCTEGSVPVSSWWRLGFEKVKYPWGMPIYSGPVVHSQVDFVLLLPTLANADEDEDGVNVFLALRPHQMTKFQQLFYDI